MRMHLSEVDIFTAMCQIKTKIIRIPLYSIA